MKKIPGGPGTDHPLTLRRRGSVPPGGNYRQGAAIWGVNDACLPWQEEGPAAVRMSGKKGRGGRMSSERKRENAVPRE